MVMDNDEKILKLGKERFKKCAEFYEELYLNGQDDQDFLYGKGQWYQRDEVKRKEEGRPVLTLNQCLPFAHQVINDIKQSRPAIRITPFDEYADIKTAEVLQGLIRSVERNNNANDAYDMAAMNSVGSGYGWIRINTDYSDSMSFDQEPIIERIQNFRSIYIDPSTQTLDGSDIKYAFIFDDIEREEFEELYPDVDIVAFDSQKDDWSNSDTIRVAEYYYKECEIKTIYQIEVDGVQNVVLEDELLELQEAGYEVNIIDERDSEFDVIKYCKLSGLNVLEKSEWIGAYIPLVPVYGEECWIDGKRQSHSLIRQAKDAQRMYNYWKSMTTEIFALQPKAPFIGAVGSFISSPNKWANSNNENYAFLEYDVVYSKDGQRVEPPQRQMPAQGSPAMMQEANSSRDDIRGALGIFDAGLGKQGNEVSGIAIMNRQIKGENSTFHFMDNLSSSISRVGKILVDLIPKLYSERKVIRVLGLDGEEKTVPINQSYIKDQETGEERALEQGEVADGIYDLNAGKYDVVSDVGASYSSKRQEMGDKLIEITKTAPELMAVVGDKIMDSLDIPEAKEIADRLRAQMPPELLGDDPQAMRLQQAAQTIAGLQEQMKNMEAALADKKTKEDENREFKAVELSLDTKKTESDIAKTKADIAKIMSEINNNSGGDLKEVVSQVMHVTENVQGLNKAIEIIMDSISQDIDRDEQEGGEPEKEPDQTKDISENE